MDVRDSCRTYRNRGEAVMTKIPDPVTRNRRKTYTADGNEEWLFTAKPDANADKTVDFQGMYRSVGIAFDCKQTMEKSYPLKNVHPRQVEYLLDYMLQGGLSFLLIPQLLEREGGWGLNEHMYLLPFPAFWTYWEVSGRSDPLGRIKRGAPQSVPFDELQRWPQVRQGRGVLHDFLPQIEVAFGRYVDLYPDAPRFAPLVRHALRRLREWPLASGQ